jgi:predicted nucleic acid-binding protein
LLVIADRNRWGDEKRSALQKALDNLVTINLSHPSVLAAYVEVQRFSRRAQGGSRELNANDAWIVACAKAAAALLLTTDSDFSHLKEPDWQLLLVDPNPFLKQPKGA